jgi:hypothetical protein
VRHRLVTSILCFQKLYLQYSAVCVVAGSISSVSGSSHKGERYYNFATGRFQQARGPCADPTRAHVIDENPLRSSSTSVPSATASSFSPRRPFRQLSRAFLSSSVWTSLSSFSSLVELVGKHGGYTPRSCGSAALNFIPLHPPSRLCPTLFIHLHDLHHH